MRYLESHLVHVSAVTVFERVRGYALLARDASASKRPAVERARLDYLADQFVESRQERLARWRAGTMIAATDLATDMLLIHNNAGDFETIRGSIEQDPVRFPGLGPLKLIRCASVF